MSFTQFSPTCGHMPLPALSRDCCRYRQPYRLRLLCGGRGGGPSSVAPRSRSPPTGCRRDSPISSSLFFARPTHVRSYLVLNISQVPGLSCPGVCHTDCIRYEMRRQQCQCTVTMFNRRFLCYFQTDMSEIAYNYKLVAIILTT